MAFCPSSRLNEWGTCINLPVGVDGRILFNEIAITGGSRSLVSVIVCYMTLINHPFISLVYTAAKPAVSDSPSQPVPFDNKCSSKIADSSRRLNETIWDGVATFSDRT